MTQHRWSTQFPLKSISSCFSLPLCFLPETFKLSMYVINCYKLINRYKTHKNRDVNVPIFTIRRLLLTLCIKNENYERKT